MKRKSTTSSRLTYSTDFLTPSDNNQKKSFRFDHVRVRKKTRKQSRMNETIEWKKKKRINTASLHFSIVFVFFFSLLSFVRSFSMPINRFSFFFVFTSMLIIMSLKKRKRKFIGKLKQFVKWQEGKETERNLSVVCCRFDVLIWDESRWSIEMLIKMIKRRRRPKGNGDFLTTKIISQYVTNGQSSLLLVSF